MNFQYMPHTLLRFEVQVAEHCNLNCRNCMHYAPLVTPPAFLDIEEYERDLKRLSELFCGEMEWIRLMGGEPLLNPQLSDIMCMTRRYFPYGHIRIVTNGLLLLKQTKQFFELCHEHNIEIWVTKYPVDMDFQKMEADILDRGVTFDWYGAGYDRLPTMWRFPIDLRGDFDPDWNFYHCPSANGCLTLRNGKMYTCAPAAHAHHLKKYFGLNIPISDRNGIDIYKADSAKEIMEHMITPIPFCRFCDYGNKADYEDDWGISDKDRYEWISFTFSQEDMSYVRQALGCYIYGAGNWGMKVYTHLKNANIVVDGFIVTKKSGNPQSIDGIPVKELDEWKENDGEGVCFIALYGSDKIAIQHKLRQKGFKKIIPIMRM